jgi:hypothetical protein
MSELDRVGASDDHGIDFGGEKAVLGNAWNGCDCQCGLPDVRDRPKRNVQDVVGLIGQERLIAQHPEGNRSSEISEARSYEIRREREHLHRHRKAAEAHYKLAGIDHGYDASRCSSNDLFSQQGTASALDRVQTWIDLVGAIDGEVD